MTRDDVAALAHKDWVGEVDWRMLRAISDLRIGESGHFVASLSIGQCSSGKERN
jgi:hypothetical protein